VKRVLIIGAGGIMARHVEALHKIETVKITGICDIVRERAETLGRKLGAAASTDLDDALDRSAPDYVLVCTPREVRLPLIERCARAGLPVFMEKPPCHNLTTGRRIQHVIESAGLVHAVGFNRRWNDPLNEVLRRIEGQTIALVTIRFLSPFATDPVYDTYPGPYLVERSGGLVGDQGIHYVDVARYICRSEVRSITAVGFNHNLPRSQHVSTCDTACWTLEMESGAVVSHAHTWAAPAWGAWITIVTNRSSITTDMLENNATGTLDGKPFDYAGTVSEAEAQHRGFLEAVETGDMTAVRSPYADALNSFRVAAEINQLIYGRTDELS